MKVAMLTSSYPKYAGETTAPFIEEIAVSLAARGHEIHVLAPFHRDLRRQPMERGVHLHFYRYSPVQALNIWGYAEAMRADVGLRRRTLAAVPLALGATVAALDKLLRRAHAAGRPFDLVHAHWLLPNAPPAALVAARHSLPLVISMHGSDVYLAERHAPLGPLAGTTLRRAGATTACSGDLYARALRLGAPANRSRVVHYGVDPETFRPDPVAATTVRQELGLAPDTPLILALGRLVYKKGFSYLLDAMPAVLKQHPQATLILAGYGDLRTDLERQAQRLGLNDQVHFPGALNRQRVAAFMSSANVFAVPSVRDDSGNVDGLPNVLLEGMAMRCPIVASRVAGIPEAVSDGIHGLLVGERSVEEIAAAINRLLADRALAERLGSAARQRIEEELNWACTARQFEETYQQALNYYT